MSTIMIKVLLVTLFVINAIAASNKNAIARLEGGEISGYVTFTKTADGVKIVGKIEGLTEGPHGFHIHQFGNLTEGCASTGSHYNPYNKTHGSEDSENRHMGDLGNIEADADGIANILIINKKIDLNGEYSILGRAFVIHRDVDDLGLGGFNDSSSTGHAGDRLGCGIIGLTEEGVGPGGNASKLILNTYFAIILYVLSMSNLIFTN